MMGRRKIEIKAIKDDRNRSVTFLKRKGGLFKKAHELSVLCSVDVAVIIFGHNKKLYEFSSGDINDTIGRYQYYGQPHEHKGPADFRGKGGGDDDDDDDDEDMAPSREESIPPQQHPQMMPPHIQHQPPFGHLRNPMPSASPPSQNGMFAVTHGSPQPQMASRPSSRDTTRRSSSNLVPMQHPKASTPQPGQNGFAYVSNQPLYDPRAHPNLNPPPTAPPHFQQFPRNSPSQPIQQPQQHPHQHPQQPTQPHPQQPQPQHQQHQSQPQHHHQQQQQQQQPQHPQVQHAHQAHQAFLQAQRRESMPPTVPQQERPQPTPPMQREQLPSASPPQPPPPQQSLRPAEHQSPPQPKYLISKSRSIFTPIDASGSVLASHFFGRSPDPPRTEIKEEEQSPGTKSRPRQQSTVPRPNTQPARTNTMSSDGIVPPSRTNTASSVKSAAARPRLKVQIPSEASDGESATAEDSSPAGPHQTSNGTGSGTAAIAAAAAGAGAGTASTPTPSSRRRSDSHHSSGVVLPAPSPSASALLSAGASGPPNPFARPPPPPQQSTPNQQNNNAYADNRNSTETPISALPSRFVADNLLPSPSSFYPDWGFSAGNRSSGGAGAHDSGMLPSPLTFPTPVVAGGAPQGWGRPGTGTGAGIVLGGGEAATGPPVGEKRKSSAGGPGDGNASTSNGRLEGSESKKVRI